MKLRILLCLLIFPYTLLAQQASIKGKVFGKEETLVGANLVLEPNYYGATTNADGSFLFHNIPSGEYTIKATYVGYQFMQQKITLEEEQTLILDLALNPLTSLSEVVVTGTMKPVYISKSPVKIDVITNKQLDTYTPAAASSIIEGVQLVNGVQEVVACGVCYTNSISINGLDGVYTAVLMDGTPMYGNLAAVYGLNGIPSMIIDRFEVIKGPSSTLYGSEAVAGVINIITKNPEKQPLLSVDLMATSHLESFGNIALAPKIGQTTGYIGLNYAYVNDFEDINDDQFGDAISLDRYSVFSKWNIHRKSGKKFSLAAKYYYEDRRNGVEEFLMNRNYRNLRGSDQVYGESIYTNRIELFGTYEFNTRPYLKLDFSLSNHDQDSYYGSDYYKAKQQIAFSNLIWNAPLRQHDILIGLTACYNAYDDNSVATETQQDNGHQVNRPNNQFIPGFFIQDEWSANSQWTILGGARLDHYSSHGFIFAPRLNIKYTPTDWTSVRGNFGTGFRVVNLFTEDHAFINGQRTVEITETLNPERSYNISLSMNHVYALLGGTGSVDVESYYTHFVNKIIPDYDIPSKIVYANSDGYARTMGLGVTINQNFAFPLAFNLGFNVQRAVETEIDQKGHKTTQDIKFAPKYSGVFSANYKWKKHGLTFAYTAQLTGTMALPTVFDVDDNGVLLTTSRSIKSNPFSLHNIQITKEFKKAWTFYGGIQNLFNFVQTTSPLVGYNDPNAAVGFSPFFDTSYAYAPNHRREVYVGIKWDLGRK